MNMQLRVAVLTVAAMGSSLSAQQPYQPPATDQGRVPAFQSGTGGSSFDQSRQPALQSAGTGVGSFDIQSFPSPQVGPMQSQFVPPRPALSPYLNLIRGNNFGGIGAIDYFNFVRPAQQANGSFVGRPLGQNGPYNRTGFGGGLILDPETNLAATTRGAGGPATFLNYGGYFNRLGTIGQGFRTGQQQQQQRAQASQGRR